MTKKKPSPRQARAQPANAPDTRTLVSRPKPMVFISHDSRDADLAEAFGNLLSDVSAGTLKSFRSSDRKGTAGIEFGAEWYKSIMSTLGDATDVVALLTRQSVDRPWILYEAGVAKGKLDTTVFGVAIGIPLEKASTGPFAQFQNCGDDEDSLTKLVLQLLQRNPEAAPREEAIRMQVGVFRENISQLMKDRAEANQEGAEPSLDEASIPKLFEEVKVMVRDLPEKVDAKLQGRRAGIRRLRRDDHDFDALLPDARRKTRIPEYARTFRRHPPRCGYVAAWWRERLAERVWSRKDFPDSIAGSTQVFSWPSRPLHLQATTFECRHFFVEDTNAFQAASIPHAHTHQHRRNRADAGRAVC